MNAYINEPIPIIDLFAGPGGLGEGFLSILNKQNQRLFKIALSIEKDDFAHKTLTLRSFTRQFPVGKIPDEYYRFLHQQISLADLYRMYPEQASKSHEEAWKFTLGNTDTHGVLDRRITKALKGKKDFVLIGGPPCQAYSLVGRARRRQKSLDITDERVYLYREYYRILSLHRPAVFVMENVKGILSSKIENDNLFSQIIDDLKDPIQAYKKLQGKEIGYKSRINYKIYSLVKAPTYNDLFQEDFSFKPNDYVIRAENYGVPQTRHRVILIGIRSDVDKTPELLKLIEESVPVENVINGLPPLRSGLSKTKDSKDNWTDALNRLKETNLKNDVEKSVWAKMLSVVEEIEVPKNDRGGIYVQGKVDVTYLKDWFIDKKIGGAINHETRSHIELDIHRYLFVSCFAEVHNRSPKLFEFPNSLLPRHENIKDGKFTDRFRVQLYGVPSKTVTSHISKDGHYFIHPDPSQCRSMTVREAARIQTFPDNYFFCGGRTQQYHQVGNAVPPYLAYQIAQTVNKIV